jgi:hypothetical protein
MGEKTQNNSLARTALIVNCIAICAILAALLFRILNSHSETSFTFSVVSGASSIVLWGWSVVLMIRALIYEKSDTARVVLLLCIIEFLGVSWLVYILSQTRV